MIQTIKFKCETITPMFLAGADGTTPELRAPSIKGALRFWWRALNANLVTENDYSELKRQESAIFGGTDSSGRSKVIISLADIKEIKTEKISLTPHHKNEFVNGERDYKATKRNGIFYSFFLEMSFDNSVITEIHLRKVVLSMFYLGGLGKRSRRGFGSVNLIDCGFDASLYTEWTNEDGTPDYPFIKRVILGVESKSYKELLVKIGEATHSFKDNSLGFARGSDRLSSPLYTSIIKTNINNYQIIITELNTVYPDDYYGNEYKQKQFIKNLTK